MIPTQRYRALFGTPDLAPAMIASVLGRFPIGLTGLVILLFMQKESGSFAKAGGISALYVFGLAVVAPAVGRLVDRFGPRPVLSACAVIYPAALIALIAFAAQSAAGYWIALCAAIAGAALPPVTVCMRALYPQLVRNDLLASAYSLDSALVEMMFIAGPIAVALFVAIEYPQGALWLAAFSAVAGSVIFLRSRAVQSWKRHPTEGEHSLLGPLRDRKLALLFAATVLYAAAFGLIEVAITGLATQQGAPAAAGIILGIASVGSTAGALIYGSRSWRAPIERQFLRALVAMAAGIFIVAPITDLRWFTFASIFACSPIAVALAAESTLISRVAPPSMLTESFTWMTTSALVGVSAGIAAGGAMLEMVAPSVVLAIAGTATVFAALIALLGLNRTTVFEIETSLKGDRAN